MYNDEEKDLFIKSELKDNYIPERIDNLFNNSINLIENERGMNMEQNNLESKKSLPKKSFMKKIVAFAACAVIVLGGGQIYASTQGYGNVFFMIKYLITGNNITITDKNEILSDRDISISYEPINITPNVAIQVKKMQVKDNQATLILQVREKNVKETLNSFAYNVEDENGNKLFSNVMIYGDINSDGMVNQSDVELLSDYLSKNGKEISNTSDVNKDKEINMKDLTILKRYVEGIGDYKKLPYIENTTGKDMVDYVEEMKLEGFKNNTKKLKLDIFDNSSSKIVSLQIDLENRVIEVEGEENALEKISEIELKEFLEKIPKLYDENGKIIYSGDGKIFFALSISNSVKTVDLKINGESKIAYRVDEINSILESFCGEKIDSEDEVNDIYSRYNENGVEYFVYEYGEGKIEPVECIDVSNISYCGGLYTATFTYCDLDGESIFDVDINDYDIYQNTVIFKINEEQNNTSKFRVVSIEKPIVIRNKEENQYNIEGIYKLQGLENSESVCYEFADGKVSYETNAVYKGIYEIIGDKIKITYTIAYEPGEIIPMENFEKEDELTIINSNQLRSERTIDGQIYYGEYLKQEKVSEDNKDSIVENYIDYANDTSYVEDVYGEKLKASNTLKYAVMKEYGEEKFKDHQFAYASFGHQGDSAAWEEIDSNYDEHKRGSEIKIGKYTEIINSEMAVLNEAGRYNESMTLKESVSSMYNSIKNNNFYKDAKFQLTGMCIMNGNCTSEEDYNNNSRAKKIKVTINDEKEYIFELEDTNKPQLFDMDVEQLDISKTMNVKVEVLETYKGLKNEEVYITEIGFGLNGGVLGAR